MDVFSQLSMTDMANALLDKLAISVQCKVDRDESLHAYRAVLHELDKTISSMKSLVRGRLNSLSAINRLPPEILARVFAFIPTSICERDPVQFDFHRDISQFCGLSATGDLNPLEHVPLTCRYWRDVALSTPSLWSDLVVGEVESKSSALPPAASQILASSNVPLYVTVSNIKFLGAAFDLVNKLGSRVQECIFDGANTTIAQHYSSIGENLRVCAFTRTAFEHASVLLFEGRTPLLTLEVLYIHDGVFIPSNHFPALTTLILDNGDSEWFGEGFTFEDFAELLSNCPALQSLYLRELQHCFTIPPVEQQSVLTSTPVITLPHLRRLSILGDIVQTGLFRPRRLGLNLFRLLLTALQPYTRPAFVWLSSEKNIRLEETSGLLARLVPSMHDFHYMRLTAHNAWFRWEPQYGLEVVTSHRSQGFRMDFPVNEVDASDLRAALSLYNVRTLWIAPGAATLVERPISVLQALPHVTTLVLMLNDDDGDTPVESLVACEEEATPCPELHTLCVYLTTVWQGEKLRDALRTRTDGGFPISRLVVVCLEESEYCVESVLEGVKSCEEFVQDLTIVPYGETVPEELLWEWVVPYECSHPSQLHRLWETWV